MTRACLVVFSLSILLFTTTAAQDTVQVLSGWNIIGSLEKGAVPDILTTVPAGILTSAFYGYAPGTGYQSGDTLHKGLGYWIKVNADGIVIFQQTGAQECGEKTVDYGGLTYHTVPIGNQCWLAENLNVGSLVGVGTLHTNNAVIEKYCYNDIATNCLVYGGLYSWPEAMSYTVTAGAQGICPAGWHIPTQAEFQTLAAAVGNDANALKRLGEGSGAGAGSNTSGFSALLTGFRDGSDAGFESLGTYSLQWTSTQYGTNTGYAMHLNLPDPTIYEASDFNFFEENGFSVRCVED